MGSFPSVVLWFDVCGIEIDEYREIGDCLVLIWECDETDGELKSWSFMLAYMMLNSTSCNKDIVYTENEYRRKKGAYHLVRETGTIEQSLSDSKQRDSRKAHDVDPLFRM